MPIGRKSISKQYKLSVSESLSPNDTEIWVDFHPNNSAIANVATAAVIPTF